MWAKPVWKTTPIVYDILYMQLKGAQEGDVSLMGHVHRLTDYSKYNRTLRKQTTVLDCLKNGKYNQRERINKIKFK